MKLEDIYKKIEALDEALTETASASINMTGDTAEDVIKLMKAVKGEPVDMDKAHDHDAPLPKMKTMPPMGPIGPKDDMAMLRDIVKGKEEAEPEVEGDYANEPDEKYQDHHYMTKDIAGGHDHGQKKSYPKVAGGDNPMALEDEIKAELSAALAEKMSEGKDCGCDEHDDHAKCEDDCHCDETIAEGEEKKVQLPSGKEIKKCHDDGMSKADIVKKYVEAGCKKEEIEKLYASSCM